MGLYISGFPFTSKQPCFTCGTDFTTTQVAQILNEIVYFSGPLKLKGNPYGQFCEGCCRTSLQGIGTTKQLEEAIHEAIEEAQHRKGVQS